MKTCTTPRAANPEIDTSESFSIPHVHALLAVLDMLTPDIGELLYEISRGAETCVAICVAD
jgi:hypothetical protein